MLPGYPLVLASASSAGAAVTGIVAASIMPASSLCTIPAGALQLGSLLKIKLRGVISNIVTTPGTLTFDLRIGGVIVSAFGAVPLNIVANTNAAFDLEIVAVVRSLGAGTVATIIASAEFTSRAIVGSATAAAGGASGVVLPETAMAVGTGFNSTAALTVDAFATFSLTGNSITVYQALIELKV
jgi:hypothetical protein